MKGFEETCKDIRGVDKAIASDVQLHLDDLTKPRGSLGRLEDLAMQYCLARGTVSHPPLKKKIFCFAGDHGVTEEGVSAFPKEVTPQMVMNMLSGGAAINVLARHIGADLAVVDMGVDDPLEDAPGLVRCKVKNGTDNIAKGPAMSVNEARQALEAGIALAYEAHADGISILGTGDMGIGNTTPSAALFCALLDKSPAELTGRGTGIDDKALANKINVIQRALEVNKERLTDPLAILAALGGLEIAGICGLILGAAACRIPVVVDGFISSAASLVACRMSENVRDYLFFGHVSHEKGHRLFLESIGAEPILDLQMRLGEGTGAALAISIIEASLKISGEMATFSSAGVSEES